MKRYLFISVLLLFFISCSGPEVYKGIRSPASSQEKAEVTPEEFSEHLTDFQNIIEENLVWREQAIRLFESVSKKVASDKPLTNGEIQKIHIGTEKYLQVRKKVMSHVEFTKWFTDKNVTIEMIDSGESQILIHKKKWTKGDEPTRYVVEINPNDSLGKLYIKSIKLSLAASLILYDNYILGVRPYYLTPKLRRIIDRDTVEYSKALEQITKNFTNVENYKRVSKALGFTKMIKAKRGSEIALEQEELYLDALLQSSYSFTQSGSIKVEDVVSEDSERASNVVADKLASLGKNIMNGISKIFGNSVGLVQTRKGRLTHMSPEERAQLTGKLKSLDILLEKTPFRLTDRFIPGHWGHVAVWVGNEAELKELGVWEELPKLYEDAKRLYNYDGQSFQDDIRSGHRIVEALRPGVEINTLEHFLNIDDFASLRVTGLTKEDKKRFLIQAFRQIGKEYDFNFDVETYKKIVCSELAYVVFNEGFSWPTSKAAGRHTISPDNVAELAVGPNAKITPAVLYHKGMLMKEKFIIENFERLLKLQYDEIQY